MYNSINRSSSKKQKKQKQKKKNSLFDVNKDVYALQGYTCFSSDLTQGRGVLLYVKDNIPAIEVVQIVNFSESAWCKIIYLVEINL